MSRIENFPDFFLQVGQWIRFFTKNISVCGINPRVKISYKLFSSCKDGRFKFLTNILRSFIKRHTCGISSYNEW